ncbi:MAG: chemotaxis protein CheA [Nannocystaceae bacterium]
MTGVSEFVSEAQDIVEAFSRQLLALEAQLRRAEDLDPEALNAAFREVHTLKGLAALTGRKEIVELSDSLESCLDALRLGRRELDQDVLDVCFECVEAFGQLLIAASDARTDGLEMGTLVARLEAIVVVSEGANHEPAPALDWLDESMVGVLTEYEEHRLQENVRRGRAVLCVRARFDLMVIDVGLEALKTKLQECGEVITYLPSSDGTSDDKIEMDILVGSERSEAEFAAVLVDQGVELRLLRAAVPVASASTRTNATGTDIAVEAPAVGQAGAEVPHLHLPSSPASPLGPVLAAGSRAQAVDLGAGIAQGATSNAVASADAMAPALAPELSLRSLSQTVRVDLRRLDLLMNLVGELALVEANLDGLLTKFQQGDEHLEVARDFRDQLRIMNRKLTLLQQAILEVRMVPLGQVFDKLARIVRKISRDSGKDVQLSITGADTELDKRIVEELSDPLMHMVRNAIDHGIETPDERVSLGKPSRGTIELIAYQKGNRVVIELEDDGHGMDWRNIRDAAIRKGTISAEAGQDLSRDQAMNLIFTPGFSTRDEATSVSGRGVGMDVVKTNIARISGMIEIQSVPGKGTQFSITLPVTLAIIQALVIQTADQTFCVPLNSVLESIMVQDRDVSTVEGHAVVSLRGRTLPLVDLAEFFELDRAQPRAQDYVYVVVVGLAQHRIGLVVDDLLGQQDVVIKPLGSALRQMPGIAGATELDANRTVLLLDVGSIVAEALKSPRAGREERGRNAHACN